MAEILRYSLNDADLVSDIVPNTSGLETRVADQWPQCERGVRLDSRVKVVVTAACGAEFDSPTRERGFWTSARKKMNPRLRVLKLRCFENFRDRSLPSRRDDRD